jgi:hypothetical protein
MAETAEEATNFEEATKYYNKISEKTLLFWCTIGKIVFILQDWDTKNERSFNLLEKCNQFCWTPRYNEIVGKEINSSKYNFPNLLNHYNKFSGLNDSYVDLVDF